MDCLMLSRKMVVFIQFIQFQEPIDDPDRDPDAESPRVAGHEGPPRSGAAVRGSDEDAVALLRGQLQQRQGHSGGDRGALQGEGGEAAVGARRARRGAGGEDLVAAGAEEGDAGGAQGQRMIL